MARQGPLRPSNLAATCRTPSPPSLIPTVSSASGLPFTAAPHSMATTLLGPAPAGLCTAPGPYFEITQGHGDFCSKPSTALSALRAKATLPSGPTAPGDWPTLSDPPHSPLRPTRTQKHRRCLVLTSAPGQNCNFILAAQVSRLREGSQRGAAWPPSGPESPPGTSPRAQDLRHSCHHAPCSAQTRPGPASPGRGSAR